MLIVVAMYKMLLHDCYTCFQSCDFKLDALEKIFPGTKSTCKGVMILLALLSAIFISAVDKLYGTSGFLRSIFFFRLAAVMPKHS